MNPKYGGDKEADTGLWIDCKGLYYGICRDNIPLISQGPDIIASIKNKCEMLMGNHRPKINTSHWVK